MSQLLLCSDVLGLPRPADRCPFAPPLEKSPNMGGLQTIKQKHLHQASGIEIFAHLSELSADSRTASGCMCFYLGRAPIDFDAFPSAKLRAPLAQAPAHQPGDGLKPAPLVAGKAGPTSSMRGPLMFPRYQKAWASRVDSQQGVGAGHNIDARTGQQQGRLLFGSPLGSLCWLL